MHGPDFIVVGAPKCGTTSLHRYLSRHSDVFVGRKEPHYFGSDLDFAGRRMSFAEYEQSFASAEERINGDISVWYLYSTRAAVEIRNHNPKAKIVIMLRNPVDQMYSMHSQALFTRDENEPDFQTAIDLERQRTTGTSLPPFANVKHAIFYRAIAQFSTQILRFRNEFSSDQIHYALLDDLREAPEAAWRDLEIFLDISQRSLPAGAPANPNKVNRSKKLADATASLPRVAARRLGLALLPRPAKDKLIRIHGAVRDWNRVYAPRSPMDENLRAQLINEFSEEVSALESILDRDLTQWRR